jgi:hypothetical protein
MRWTWQRNLVTFTMLLFGTCSSVYAQFQTAQIVKFKLEVYGWQPLPQGQAGQHGEHPGTPSHLISIDHNNRVLVGFSAREDYSLATREHPGLSFHILRFTPEGKIDISLVLPTKDYFTNGLYLGADDQILARANDLLQVLPRAIKPGHDDVSWQPLAPCPSDCYVGHSFSRRTTILRTSEKPFNFDNLTYTVVDTSSSSPSVVQTCSRMAFYAEKITDKFAYWPNYDRDDARTVRFTFCDVDNYQELPWTGGGGFFPLNDDAFLLLSSDKDRRGVVKLVGRDGQVRFQHTMREKDDVPQYYVGFWATSDERGDRFAFTVETWRGGSRFFDISGKLVARRIVVYDEKGRELASVPVSTAYHRDFDFSLSPDGHRLAILDEGVVTVVDMQ